MKPDLQKHATTRKVSVQYELGKQTHYVSGREAQALLALIIRKKGLTHLDFQVNFNGGYRLGAYIHLLREVLSIETVTEESNGIRYARYYLMDKPTITKVGI